MTRSEIRREIKNNAKVQLDRNKSTLIIVNIIVGIIATLPSFIQGYIVNSYTTAIVVSIFTFLIGLPLTIGLMNMNLQCIKGEKIRVKDILKGFDRLYQVYGVTLIQSVIMMILTTPLILIPIVMLEDNYQISMMVSMISTIANTFFIIIFSQVEYIVADKKDVSPIEAVRKSVHIMKRHLLEFIILELSFIGWILLIGITFGIAAIWVAPYMNLCYANYYEYVKEDNLQEYKKSKPKGIAIGLLVGVLLCGYSVASNNISSWLLAPNIIKEVVKKKDLNLISLNTEEEYFISEEEINTYNIKEDELNKYYFTKYTLLVSNHPLDSQKGDKIKNTIVYIIADNNKVLGISCEPYDSNFKITNWNPNPGKYDINGKLIK
ncbi:MAG: DUF975 family protein [Peptostreptococcaceae bacterium]